MSICARQMPLLHKNGYSITTKLRDRLNVMSQFISATQDR
jgi:hypothetical protein